MTITYQHDTFVTTGSSPAETFDEVYPSVIDYTARTGAGGELPRRIQLEPSDAVGTRPDITINARPGFLELDATAPRPTSSSGAGRRRCRVRHYKLFTSRTRRTSPTRCRRACCRPSPCGARRHDDRRELYRHTFEYNKAPATTAMFSGEQTWGQAWQAATPPQTGYVPRTNDGLSHSVDGLVGGSITLGVGFPYISVTGNFGMDYGWVAPDLAFLGITGQGLPDQVDANGTLSQNSPLLVAPATNHFAAMLVTESARPRRNRSLGMDGRRQHQRDGGPVRGRRQLCPARAGRSQDHHRHERRRLPRCRPPERQRVLRVHQRRQAELHARSSGRVTASRTRRSPPRPDWPTSMWRTRSSGPSPLIRWVAPFTGQVTINSQADVGNPLDDVVVEFYVANDAGEIDNDLRRSRRARVFRHELRQNHQCRRQDLYARQGRWRPRCVQRNQLVNVHRLHTALRYERRRSRSHRGPNLQFRQRQTTLLATEASPASRGT